MQPNKSYATTFCSGIHVRPKLPAVAGVPSQGPPRHHRYQSRGPPKAGRYGNRAEEGREESEPALRGEDDVTTFPLTPPSVLSRKSREHSPAGAGRGEGQRAKAGRKHHGFFDPRALNRSVDALQDPGVTVYCSVLDPERKLRASALEKVAIRNPSIHLSPQKLEKLNRHFADKSYNWRLKDQLAAAEARPCDVAPLAPPSPRRRGAAAKALAQQQTE